MRHQNWKALTSLLLTLLFALTIGACNARTQPTPQPEPTPTPEPKPETPSGLFHIWQFVDKTATDPDKKYVLHLRENLREGSIGLGEGIEKSEKELKPYVIQQGEYFYYQSENHDFVKYDKNVQVVKKFPLPNIENRKHAHTWLDDQTLLLISYDSKVKKMTWAKVNTADMKALATGHLDLEIELGERDQLNSSGLVTYRKSDNMLIYSFVKNTIPEGKRMGAALEGKIHIAFIDATTMEVKKQVEDDRVDTMEATAFGELRQHKTFTDEHGDYYIACGKYLNKKKNTERYGRILRVKAGEMDIDRAYEGYKYPTGKIVTMNYLGDDKILLYIQDPSKATPDKPNVWDKKKNPYVFYWEILDIKTDKRTHLTNIPYSAGGNFGQLAAIVGDKVYIAANTKANVTTIYVYDIPTGQISEGTKLAEGMYVERILYFSK